jgi:type II secretory pathway pseudopilin PulG
MRTFTTKKLGMGLVEVVVAVAILGTALGSIIITYSYYITAALQNTEVIKATYLAEEGMEAIRILRDDDWDANIAPLSMGTDLYLTYATTTKTWSVTTSPANNYVDGKYMRTVRMDRVSRNSSQDIVASGGTVDADIKYVEVTVAWQEGEATTTRSLAAYITNLFNE